MGVKGKTVTWVINESQLNNDLLADWVNSILKLGIVPCLFDNEEKMKICD